MVKETPKMRKNPSKRQPERSRFSSGERKIWAMMFRLSVRASVIGLFTLFFLILVSNTPGQAAEEAEALARFRCRAAAPEEGRRK
jgi:hypothetical protein